MDPDLVNVTCGADPSWICKQVLEWTSGNEFVARTADFLLARPLKIVLIILLAIIANRLLGRAVRKLADRVAAGNAPGLGVVRTVRERTPTTLLPGPSARAARAAARAQTIGQVLGAVASAIVFSVAALLVLGEIGINLGPLLAGAGIAGVAIGFGAQSLVKDFLSGIFMLLEDQYGVGDVIDVGEATGSVEAVTLRSTRLRDIEGTVWHVPNGEIRRVGNKSQGWARAVIDVEVAYNTDVRRATEVIEQTARRMRDEAEWGRLIQRDPELLGIESFGSEGVRIRLSIQTEPGQQFLLMRELRLRLAEDLAEAGIKLPIAPGTMVMQTPPTGATPPVAAKAAAKKARPARRVTKRAAK